MVLEGGKSNWRIVFTAAVILLISSCHLFAQDLTELREDRSNWMKIYGRDIDDSYLVNDLEVDVHTIALELEQLSRWNKIYYDDLETMVKDLYNREFVSEKLKDMLKKLQHQFDKEKNVEKRKG